MLSSTGDPLIDSARSRRGIARHISDVVIVVVGIEVDADDAVNAMIEAMANVGGNIVRHKTTCEAGQKFKLSISGLATDN